MSVDENIFNLFYFTDGVIISDVGVVKHAYIENDEESCNFLRSAVSNDYKMCRKYSLPININGLNADGTLNYSTYMSFLRLGRGLELFEEIFVKYSASPSPLTCVTPIVNGVPTIDISTDHTPFMYGDYQEHPKSGSGVMRDYLQDYMKEEGFDLPLLIHNDYFGAIKLLYNNGHYVSCMKLLASFIDTIAYLEYGDDRGIFLKWLDTFCDLNAINITSAELWELRNSMLHMSNLDSRNVLSGKEKRISFFVAEDDYVSPEDNEIKYFNLKSLMDVVAQGISGWVNSFNLEPNKFRVFVERYDKIISDNRHAIYHK